MRRALEELGPVFIKFGQSLATRRDLLEPEIIAELQSLTDDVPPFHAGEAVAIIEACYKSASTGKVIKLAD